VLQFVHFASDQITAANTTGTAAALRNASRGLGMTRTGTAALAGGAGAVGGWLAGKAATGGGKAAQPTGPAAAVGGRPGTKPGGAGSGGTPSSANGSTSPAAASSLGDDGPAPTPAGDVEPAAPIPTPAASTGSPSAESPDAVQWPRMHEHFNRQAQESGHRPFVHPTDAAQALSIPRSQADRMFLVAETQGLLGPQQVDGSRRLLVNDRLPAPMPGGTRP
jgi:hypothetical protein